MKLIIGGSIAIALSLFGFAYTFSDFFKFLAGLVPVSLLLGGCVALYVYRETRCDEECEPEAAEACCGTTGRPEGVSCNAASEPESWKPGDAAAVKETPAEESAAPEPPAPEEAAAKPEEDTAAKEDIAATVDDAGTTETPEEGASEETEAAAEDTPEQAAEEKAEQSDVPETEEKEPVKDETLTQDNSFVGNEESRVFHKSSCQYAKSKKCTASFAARDEAVSAGYKACGVCKP